jgi:hypothetical protein
MINEVIEIESDETIIVEVTETEIAVLEPSVVVNINGSTGGGTWGSITGEITDQTDLSLALSGKVDKEAGKGLSENDYTDADKAIVDSTPANLDLRQNKFVGISEMTPITESELDFDHVNRVLTINPLRGEFDFYVDGDGIVTKFNKVAEQVFPAFSDTTGAWWFYYDRNGNMVTTQTTPEDFDVVVPIARIVWNSAYTGANKIVSQFVEYHTNTISAVDHDWKHAYGAIYKKGFDSVHNRLVSGAPNADGRNTCFALSTGTSIDDNLEYTVTNDTSGNVWTQDMGNTNAGLLTSLNSGIFKIRYKGVVSAPELVTGTRFPFLWNTGNNRPQYVNSSGVRTDVTNGYFFVSFIYSIQDPRPGNTVRITPAYQEYSSLTNAQAATWATVQAQDDAAKDNEIRVLYRLIFQCQHSVPNPYDVAVKYSALRDVQDLRKTVISQASAQGGSLPATSVTYTPNTFITSTNVQAAIDELSNLVNTIESFDPSEMRGGTSDAYTLNTIGGIPYIVKKFANSTTTYIDLRKITQNKTSSQVRFRVKFIVTESTTPAENSTSTFNLLGTTLTYTYGAGVTQNTLITTGWSSYVDISTIPLLTVAGTYAQKIGIEYLEVEYKRGV